MVVKHIIYTISDREGIFQDMKKPPEGGFKDNYQLLSRLITAEVCVD